MANLWKQGVQENKDFWKNGKLTDKIGGISSALGAASGIIGSSLSLAKGNKAALDSVKQQASAINQQMVGSDSLDNIYDTALSYNPMSTNHKWQEFFANGGYLHPDYDYLDYVYYPNSYGAGGKILSTGLGNVASGASAGMTVGGPLGAAIGGAVGLIGTALGGIFGHSKAKKMARQANALSQEANEGMQYKINSAIDDNAYNTLQGYENALPYAYGGYLDGDMGAIGYGLANDYLAIKDKQVSNKQTPLSYLGNSYIKDKPMSVFDDNNSFANGGGIHIKKSHEGLFTEQAKKHGMSVQEFANHVLAHKDEYPSSTVRRANFAKNASSWNNGKARRYALGGDVQTNGGDFSDGLTEINTGGTHEENPNGGVPMGVAPDNSPNLVEEGETIYDDYVFSNRIKPDEETLSKFHMPKDSNLTYADLSKKLEKESRERPNDPISQDGLSAMLGKLAQEQERQKAEEEEEEARVAYESLSPEEKQAFVQELARSQEAQAQAGQQQVGNQGNDDLSASNEGTDEVDNPQDEADNEQQQQVSPEQQQAMQQQMVQQQAMEGQQEDHANGGELHEFANGGKKHVGTWKKGWDEARAWKAYAMPALDDFILQTEANLKGVKDPVQRQLILQDAANRFNAIQKSYQNAYQAPSGSYAMNDNVLKHQLAWDTAGGNKQYYPGKGFGIADRINLPNGANTKDRYNTWNDGLWGPQTSTRNYGSTLYGDSKLFSPYIERFKKLGLTYAPNKDYSYGKNGNELYTLSLMSIPDILKPVGSNKVPSITVPNTVKTPNITTGNTTPEDDGYKQLPTWPRYVGLFGPAVGLMMQGLGVGKNPGKDAYDSALSAITNTGYASPAHIGDYVRYNPFDIWQAQNKADTTRLATNRAIMNGNIPIGAKIAGLVANDNNYYQGNGALQKQAQEYNEKNMMDVAGFNRGTNQFNAQADNQFALANAQKDQWKAQALMNYAAQKAAQDQQWYSDMYGNVNNLFKGISDYGRENVAFNQINGLDWSGVFGPHAANLGGTPQTNWRGKAKGGKINKKRKGYTF